MSDPFAFLGLDASTVVSTAVGVIAGGLITWVAAWYYAKKSAQDMQRQIAKAVSELGNTIPPAAAKQVIANGVVNNLLTAGPLIFKVLSKLAEASKGSEPDSPGGQPPPSA